MCNNFYDSSYGIVRNYSEQNKTILQVYVFYIYIYIFKCT